MSSSLKQNFSGALTVVCAVVMVICIAKMIPYGLSGEISKVKPYFSLMMVAFLVSLPAAVAYYYYRAKNQQGDIELSRMHTQVSALAHAGQKSKTPPMPLGLHQQPTKSSVQQSLPEKPTGNDEPHSSE